MSLADEKYVAVTTFRRTGEPVSTPVWIVPLGERQAGFTTGSTSGKVKRLAHTPRVTVQACDARGRPTPGSTPTEGTARVVQPDDPTYDEVRRLIRQKYGLTAALITAFSKVSAALGRPSRTAPDRVVVVQWSSPASAPR